jgi:hypothetical protein
MATSIISLAERLRKHSHRLRKLNPRDPLAGDLRFAAFVARRFAALKVAEAARKEGNPRYRRALEHEAAQLWCGHE